LQDARACSLTGAVETSAVRVVLGEGLLQRLRVTGSMFFDLKTEEIVNGTDRLAILGRQP